MIYAGIGSRDTPSNILKLFESLGFYLGKCGVTLRSGGAKGADDAFESGCNLAGGIKEIYLPWNGFENKNGIVINNPQVSVISNRYHPNYDNLTQGAKKLIDRDTYQIIGPDFLTFSDFVICYTKNGMGNGGTGQAIRIADAYNIPVFDVGLYDRYSKSYEYIVEETKIFLNEFGL